MSMRVLILGAAIGIAPATISPTQAAMIGPGKLQITEPASLAEPVRARSGSGVSRVSTVRSGSGVAQGGTAGRGTRVDSRSLNLKAAQVPGRWVIYSPTVEKPYTVRRGDTLSSISASVYRRDPPLIRGR
jgi:nucleoid-associated protein YgaU